MRKRLEQDLLCEKLRGRVQYFFTIYHNAPDEYGRFAVRVDGKEVFKANPYNESLQYRIADEIKMKQNIPCRELCKKGFLHDDENLMAEEAAKEQAIDNGIATSYDLVTAASEFLNLSIEKAISSENALIRLFAILDRRVGIRTLEKLSKTIDNQPEWLRFFYKLRFEAENIAT